MANKLLFAAGVLVSFGLIGPLSAQQSGTTSKIVPPSRPVVAPAPGHGPISRELLKPESFTQIRGLIRPDDDQYVWRQIRWHTDFWTVRQKAAAQDKPILVFWLDGAGYRDPLGLC